MSYKLTGRGKHATSGASLTVATHAAMAYGPSGFHSPRVEAEIVMRKMRSPFRQERLRVFNESVALRMPNENHHPTDQLRIRLRLKREADAAAWIERIKARKGKPSGKA